MMGLLEMKANFNSNVWEHKIAKKVFSSKQDQMTWELRVAVWDASAIKG
jgi:hypothetical protein